MGVAEPEFDLLEAWGRRQGRRGQAGGHRTPQLCCSRYYLATQPEPGKPAEAKHNQIQNKHGKRDTRSDTHRSKVTRSTST